MLEVTFEGKKDEAVNVYDGILQQREGSITVSSPFFGSATRVREKEKTSF